MKWGGFEDRGSEGALFIFATRRFDEGGRVRVNVERR